MIRITSKRPGFRRLGIAHGKEPKDYPGDHFTAKELKILQDEPMLIVEEIDDEKEGKSQRLNVGETVKLVKAASDLAALEALSKGEERTGVLEAIEYRRKELTKSFNGKE